jgi:hypothetical protein
MVGVYEVDGYTAAGFADQSVIPFGSGKTCVDTRWNSDRAGDFLPTRGSCVSDSKSFPIVTGCQNYKEKRQYKLELLLTDLPFHETA